MGFVHQVETSRFGPFFRCPIIRVRPNGLPMIPDRGYEEGWMDGKRQIQIEYLASFSF
jgi:hypothetical protein